MSVSNLPETGLEIFSPEIKKLLNFNRMRVDLKISRRYEGFLFLAESARNPPLLQSHHHAELELNLVVSGSITVVAGGQRYTFSKRTLLWLFPAQEHQLVDRTPDARYYVVVFKPGLIHRACRSPGYAGLRQPNTEGGQVLHAILEPQSFDLTRRIMDELMHGSIDSDVLNREAGYGVASDFRFEHGDPDALNAGLHHLLLLCWKFQGRGIGQKMPVSLHPAVTKALALLAEEGWEESLGWLARRCGVSAPYLSKIFRQQMGVPLNRYRNTVRMRRFWELRKAAPAQTLAESAYAAGFGSYAQFYKIFEQSYGSGPREILSAQTRSGAS
jgi:AraC-like DNA-binding protein